MDDRVRVSLVLASELLIPLPDIAARAEAAGVYRVWNTEFEGRDAIVRSLRVGLSTERLNVGSGIAYAFTRKPKALAATALDVQEMTSGRFTLGLGSGTRGLRAAFAADEFDPPSTRLTEVVTELRQTWARENWVRSVPPPPIAIGGVNEVMIRDAATFGDRIVLHPLCLVEEHWQRRLAPAIERGRERRALDNDVALSAWCIASVDADAELAKLRARRQLTFYVSTPGYRAAVEGTPWEHQIAELRDRFKAKDGSLETLSSMVSDELLDQVAVYGTPTDVSKAITARREVMRGLGIDELVLQTVNAGPDELSTIMGLIDTVGLWSRS